MQRTRFALAAALATLVLLVPTVQAGNPFAGATTTAGGYHTWDSDLVDVEKVSQTGSGVYVAVLDEGLVPNWSDYFPQARVATQYGKGFYQPVYFKSHGADPCALEVEAGQLRDDNFIGSRGSSHGTHVASTIIGYSYRSNADLAQGFPLPPIQVRGIAPDATIIPVKVLADYQVPALPKCPNPALQKQGLVTFGTDEMVAAGINWVTSLKQGPLAGHPVVINMSLGGSELTAGEQSAIDNAIAAGVVVVAAAGNEGDAGMAFPGAYAPVISAGSMGWTGEWLDQETESGGPANGFRYRMWWLQNVQGNGAGTAGVLEPPLFADSGNVSDEVTTGLVYVSDFSSRQLTGQDLDVVAPGSWVRGPFPGLPGYNHLPWWSHGIGDLVGHNSGNFFYVGGTSMASPHVASVAALMLQKNPSLTAGQIESILESSALPLGPGTRQVWDPFNASGPNFYPISWGANATGSGVLQADTAIAATP